MYGGGKVEWNEAGPHIGGHPITREQASNMGYGPDVGPMPTDEETERRKWKEFKEASRELAQSFAELNERYDLIGKAVKVGMFSIYMAIFPFAWAKVGYDRLTKEDPPPVDKTLKVATAVFLGAMVASTIKDANAAPVEATTAVSLRSKTGEHDSTYLKTNFQEKSKPDINAVVAAPPGNTLQIAPVSVPEYNNTMR